MLKKRLFLILFLLLPLIGKAELTVEVVGGAAQQIPIAIVPFAAPNGSATSGNALAQPDNLTNVIGADLRLSGLFRVLETRGVVNQPHALTEVKYSDWASIQAQALTIGSVESLPGNRVKISFRLLDVLKQNQLLAMEFNVTPGQQRATAHRIADMIYEKLIGEKGAFATRVAYVNKENGRYSLQVADADGFNPQTVVSSKEPLISPSWSPDGTKLAYVSFEKKKPVIIVQSLVSGQRIVLANIKGNNSAPAWSPDGTKLAIVLTYSANSQIYVINADGTGLQQVSFSNGIDTEPEWSPDGSSIYFTSNRGGGPQIYRMPAFGGDAKRVTFEGAYNVSPHLSSDGKLLAFIKQTPAGFKVAVQDLSTGQVQTLSDTSQDESPSFAPNGRMILYATNVGGRGSLATVSVDGRVKQRLKDSGGDVREPSWGSAIN